MSAVLEILILQFDFLYFYVNVCNTILHTKIVLHLFSISNFSDCISLIITRIRTEQDCLAKSKRRLFGKVEEGAYETLLSLHGPFTIW